MALRENARTVYIISLSIVLYSLAAGFFSLRFFQIVSVSLLAGLICKLCDLLISSDRNSDFPWFMFFLLPLFSPIGVPFVAVFFSALIAFFLALKAFGGYKKHFFNPLAVAVVIMICGYYHTGTFVETLPFKNLKEGYSFVSYGLPDYRDSNLLIQKACEDKTVWLKMFEPAPKNFPGCAFPFVSFFSAFTLAFLFKRGRVFFFFSVLFYLFFAFLASYLRLSNVEIFVFAGAFPLLLFAAIADPFSIPEKKAEQMVFAFLFAFFAAVFTIYANSSVFTFFSLLLATVFAPLLSDSILKKGYKYE